MLWGSPAIDEKNQRLIFLLGLMITIGKKCGYIGIEIDRTGYIIVTI